MNASLSMAFLHDNVPLIPQVLGNAEEDSLSPHEIRLLGLLANGHNRVSAAAALRVALPTVAWHLQRIYQKLNVHSKVEAVAVALRLGLIH
jgi:ATP/maltotriose-dependent transcriptional regulator MalT